MAETADFEDDFATPQAAPTSKVDDKPKKGAKAKVSTEDAEDEKQAKGEQTPAAIAQAAAAVPAVARFTVLRDNRVAWRGQLIKLRAGSIISDHDYGPGAVEYFRARGVAMEPVA